MSTNTQARRRPGGLNMAAIDATAKPTSRLAPRIAGIGHAVITITPQMSENFLSGKLPNRGIKNNDIERYVRDIKNGSWHLNGEPWIFSGTEEDVRNGRPEAGLLDGQQRSWAVFYANIPITTLVVWGVPPESMESIDTGAKRTFGDVLTIRGIANSTVIGGAARWWHWYDNSLANERGAASVRPTHHELTESVNAHPSLEEAARLVSGNKKSRILLPPAIGCFVVSGAIEHGWREEAEKFLQVIGTGLDKDREWSMTHPLYHLHHKLQTNRASEKKMPSITVCALAIKAFHAYAFHKPMRSLKWQHGSETERPEPFPRFEKRPENRRQK